MKNKKEKALPRWVTITPRQLEMVEEIQRLRGYTSFTEVARAGIIHLYEELKKEEAMVK